MGEWPNCFQQKSFAKNKYIKGKWLAYVVYFDQLLGATHPVCCRYEGCKTVLNLSWFVNSVNLKRNRIHFKHGAINILEQ